MKKVTKKQEKEILYVRVSKAAWEYVYNEAHKKRISRSTLVENLIQDQIKK